MDTTYYIDKYASPHSRILQARFGMESIKTAKLNKLKSRISELHYWLSWV